jgi:hypothetical protein
MGGPLLQHRVWDGLGGLACRIFPAEALVFAVGMVGPGLHPTPGGVAL